MVTRYLSKAKGAGQQMRYLNFKKEIPAATVSSTSNSLPAKKASKAQLCSSPAQTSFSLRAARSFLPAGERPKP